MTQYLGFSKNHDIKPPYRGVGSTPSERMFVITKTSALANDLALEQTKGGVLSLGQTLSTFHYTLLDKCRALLSVVEREWPNALDFSLDLELNVPRMYCLMNNSFMECFVHYLMNSNCKCIRSTTLDNFALDQTSLDKKQSSRLHSARWPNALDISLNMYVERCIVKSREPLARALDHRCTESTLYVLTSRQSPSGKFTRHQLPKRLTPCSHLAGIGRIVVLK